MVPVTSRPRPYHLGRRQAGVDRTRARILSAARALLTAPSSTAFGIDAVARRARVTRATVYQRFGSRAKLLEALFDDMARLGGMRDLTEAFRQTNPTAALARVVATFGRFWTLHRPIVQRLFALGALDPELGQTLRGRNEWRRQGLREIVHRLHARGRKSHAGQLDATVDLLFTLTSFHTFDTLAGPDRKPSDVVPQVLQTCLQLLGLPAK
jgi:AcrR family transcriptional regulator